MTSILPETHYFNAGNNLGDISLYHFKPGSLLRLAQRHVVSLASVCETMRISPVGVSLDWDQLTASIEGRRVKGGEVQRLEEQVLRSGIYTSMEGSLVGMLTHNRCDSVLISPHFVLNPSSQNISAHGHLSYVVARDTIDRVDYLNRRITVLP